ncbi:putative DNA (cytosine-5-)-methyltransferase [Dioscorea sansibarensis]
MPIKRLALRSPKAFKTQAPSPRSPGSASGREEIDQIACLIDDLVSLENRPESNGVDANADSDLRSGSTESNGGVGDPLIGGLRRCLRTLEHRSVVVEDEISGDLERPPASKKAKVSSGSKKPGSKDVFFVGDPVPDEEARGRWPHHYEQKVQKKKGRRSIVNTDDEDEITLEVKCHYLQASVNKEILSIGDCVYVKGEKWKPNYVGKIVEFFETAEEEYYFTVQWFFRAADTVIKDQAVFHDKHRLFFSDLKNDNPLNCIVSRVTVIQVSPCVELKHKMLPPHDFYYDMKYSVEYSTFSKMEEDDSGSQNNLTPSNCSETIHNRIEEKLFPEQVHQNFSHNRTELALLDLYCGCGGMSTALCLGAQLAGVNLVTRWAVDSDEAACNTLKFNNPETQVRNESADDFYALIKEWKKLCKKYVGKELGCRESNSRVTDARNSKRKLRDDYTTPHGEYEVSHLVDICYGDPTNLGKRGLKFKVRWKGYDPSEDTWEPIAALNNSQRCIQNFVREGLKAKILPLPGDVDVMCGGPPCQGISGLNRFRNFAAPLDDEQNRQIVVFMDIVQFLKPKYVLMENVVDILRFAKAALGRYALSRLVCMSYQARLGIMAAGCYGLPQFRLRTFIWGSHPQARLPQFPLPTHEVILRCGTPVDFECNIVGYDEGQSRVLEKALVLEDVLSDLPAVTNNEVREQMSYGSVPRTEFQQYIRTPRLGVGKRHNTADASRIILYDHRPLPQNEDDYLRIREIPRRKGASYRDLPGVVVDSSNTAQLDPKKDRVLLPSGKPLVPDYAINLREGKTSRPFGRLWWDETVATVLTAPDMHYQVIIHPEQDRVLTIRECARVQGFPDYYKFCGTIRDRYRQIGNAVAAPVGRALGYALALAWLKQSGGGPVVTLPSKFSYSHTLRPLGEPSSEVELQDHQEPRVEKTACKISSAEQVELESICAEVYQQVNILMRELKDVELSPDAMASINRLLAIGNGKV